MVYLLNCGKINLLFVIFGSNSQTSIPLLLPTARLIAAFGLGKDIIDILDNNPEI